MTSVPITNATLAWRRLTYGSFISLPVAWGRPRRSSVAPSRKTLSSPRDDELFPDLADEYCDEGNEKGAVTRPTKGEPGCLFLFFYEKSTIRLAKIARNLVTRVNWVSRDRRIWIAVAKVASLFSGTYTPPPLPFPSPCWLPHLLSAAMELLPQHGHFSSPQMRLPQSALFSSGLSRYRLTWQWLYLTSRSYVPDICRGFAWANAFEISPVSDRKGRKCSRRTIPCQLFQLVRDTGSMVKWISRVRAVRNKAVAKRYRRNRRTHFIRSS